MKTLKFLIAAILFLSIAISGCKKDDDCDGVTCQNGGNCVNGQCNCPQGWTGEFCETPSNSCAGITCQNGGTCSNGQCNCLAGYSGTYCENQETPSSATVTKFEVTQFPVTNNGSAWDPFGGAPDIYIEFGSGSTLLFTSGVIDDVIAGTGTLTYTNGLPIIVTSVTSEHTIQLLDEDGVGDDFMGRYDFTPYHASNGFPSHILLTNGGNAITIKIYVTWNH